MKQFLLFLFIVFVIMIFSQNILSMLVSQLSFLFAKSVVAIKDLILYIILFIAIMEATVKFIKHPYLKLNFRFYFIMLILIVFLLVLLNPNANILSIRQLLIMPLGFIFGILLNKYNIDFNYIFKIYIYMMFFLVLSAYIERYILFDEYETFWNLLGVGDYMSMKGFSNWAYDDIHVSRSFYTYDLLNMIDDKYRRMVSFIAEPTIFGELLVLPSVYYILRKKYHMALFFVIPILLTFSKGGIIGIIIAIAIYKWQVKSNGYMKFMMLSIFGISMFFIVPMIMEGSIISIYNHFHGLISNVILLKEYPFGLGIGQVGNYAKLVLADDELLASGESYLGTIIGQFGFIGLFLYFWLIRKMYYTKTQQNRKRQAVKYTMLAILFSGFFSESAISYVGTSLVLILMAYNFKGERNENIISYNSTAI